LHLSAAFLPSTFRLSHLVCYPQTKELTDDEDETSSSPRRQKVAEEGNMAEEPVAIVHRGVRSSGGRVRGLGKRVISRHPSPALRGHLETVPEDSEVARMEVRKIFFRFHIISNLTCSDL
jgi:hypothetical protein